MNVIERCDRLRQVWEGLGLAVETERWENAKGALVDAFLDFQKEITAKVLAQVEPGKTSDDLPVWVERIPAQDGRQSTWPRREKVVLHWYGDAPGQNGATLRVPCSMDVGVVSKLPNGAEVGHTLGIAVVKLVGLCESLRAELSDRKGKKR